ncbi:MAG: hypothetical protein IPL22_07055 [Bacteroidetes bacterium]|nr:hypothetical protein [Bacteroidota bacterium]
MKEAFSWMSLRQTMINADQAINTRSDYFTRRNSGAIMYRRTALAFEFLNDYLGESLFDSCMHKFYVDWQFQHPDGSDLRKTFEQVSGKNLDWFFDDVIATTKPSKFRIKKVNYSGDKTTLTISNTGKYHPPLKISGTVNQSPFHQWVEPFSGTKEIIIQGKEFKPELINKGYEAALKSNTASYHPNKLFKKLNLFQFGHLPGICLITTEQPYTFHLWQEGIITTNLWQEFTCRILVSLLYHLNLVWPHYLILITVKLPEWEMLVMAYTPETEQCHKFELPSQGSDSHLLLIIHQMNN